MLIFKVSEREGGGTTKVCQGGASNEARHEPLFFFDKTGLYFSLVEKFERMIIDN